MREEPDKTIQVSMWLRVENNSKFVRGKTKVRKLIEDWILSEYDAVKLDKDGWEYTLTIPYRTDEELDKIIYDDILQQADSIADRYNCFIETDISAIDNPERIW